MVKIKTVTQIHKRIKRWENSKPFNIFSMVKRNQAILELRWVLGERKKGTNGSRRK